MLLAMGNRFFVVKCTNWDNVSQQIMKDTRSWLRRCHRFRFGLAREIDELNFCTIVTMKKLCETLEYEAPVEVNRMLLDFELGLLDLLIFGEISRSWRGRSARASCGTSICCFANTLMVWRSWGCDLRHVFFCSHRRIFVRNIFIG